VSLSPSSDEEHRVPAWRTGLASRVVAAALLGVADVVDGRRRERPPQVEEAADPLEDDWLVLLDREDPSRSLVIVPQRLSGPVDQDRPPSGEGHGDVGDEGRPSTNVTAR
jgi:hypothetical protein